MISTKRLVQMARKWQKMAARGRKRISFGVVPKSNSSKKVAAIAEKGHFVAYASDGKRYMVPLACLQRPIFQELLKMAEEEFGLSINGAITFPCDSTVVDYIMSLVQRDMSSQIENALVASLSSTRCFSSSVLPQCHPCQQIPLEGF
ncbi:auxin-responsive protein SAUR64-like [Nymphaea colorata]|uniref:auxin-responsive protein SAUR64-like n=1 Tax=Nymphaea colorata TaxID=210225 RepID=UPI00129E84D5|nr:auxin-responsive protein SAUR64-like [Nymphaea colorata]